MNIFKRKVELTVARGRAPLVMVQAGDRLIFQPDKPMKPAEAARLGDSAREAMETPGKVILMATGMRAFLLKKGSEVALEF